MYVFKWFFYWFVIFRFIRIEKYVFFFFGKKNIVGLNYVRGVCMFGYCFGIINGYWIWELLNDCIFKMMYYIK